MNLSHSLILISLFNVFNISAQEIKIIRDFRFNGEVNIEKKICRNLKAGFETTIKLEKNASHTEEIDLDAYLDYKLFSCVTFGVGYRLAFNRDKDDIFNRKHRYSAECTLSEGIKRFEFSYRLRYQNIDDDFFQPDEQKPSKNILRNRAGVNYNIRKFPADPYASLEFYSLLGSNEDIFSKLKITIGTRCDLGKFGDLKIFYRIDRELSIFYPYTYFNIGAGYYFKF